MPIGRLVRITIALPVFIESVEVRGHLYVDGGLIELLPTQPAIDHGPFDHVFGINFMLPEGLTPDDITGWHNKPMGIVRATRELQQAYHVEFARRARRELGDTLTIIDAADPRLCRGAWLYDLFIDRSRWPELIRTGYERTTVRLRHCEGARASPRPARAGARPPRPRCACARRAWEDPRDVDARGLLGHEELGADLAVRRARGEQLEHLALARR